MMEPWTPVASSCFRDSAMRRRLLLTSMLGIDGFFGNLFIEQGNSPRVTLGTGKLLPDD